MIQYMNSQAFSGLGCRYGNGQCKMINMNNGPDGKGPVAYSWMTTGPMKDVCCVEQRVGVLPPDFVKGLEAKPDFSMDGDAVEWFATPGEPSMFFMGFWRNKFIKLANGSDSQYQLSAMHGGHQFFGLPGWRWESVY
jgi:hypothetical protein